MAAFTETAFRTKLKDLNSTQQSIQTISLWAIHHRKHAAKVVNIWMEEIRAAKDASRKLTLLYFANDVIQNMRKKGQEYQVEFRNVLPEAMENSSIVARIDGDEKVLKSLSRLNAVWKERAIFDDAFLLQLEQIVSGTAPSISGKAPSQPAAKVSEILPVKPSAVSDPALAKRIKLDADFQSWRKPDGTKGGDAAESEDDEYEEVKLNGEEEPPKLETLLRLIQKLQSAPSANASIRSKIADLPSIITDSNAIDKLTDRDEVERLVKVAKDGLEMVVTYNKDLQDELKDRQAVAAELARQLAFHRKLIEEKERLRDELSGEISKRKAFRDKLATHVESLPDMSNMVAPGSRMVAPGSRSSLAFQSSNQSAGRSPGSTKIAR